MSACYAQIDDVWSSRDFCAAKRIILESYMHAPEEVCPY